VALLDTYAERVLAAVEQIPPGRVMTYGDVAEYAGVPSPRIVGTVLARDDGSVPWHRVLRADGRIAFPAGSKGHREQARRLKAEGVRVDKGRVRITATAGFDMDAEVWAPR